MMRAVRVLSIQSLVAYGHVGNSAAVFPLQRLGHEVIVVPTVLFSNHTGYGAWRGRVLPVEEVRELIEGLADRGVLAGVDAVLTGYLGAPETAALVADTVSSIPGAVWCCDPVMGDAGRGMFVRPRLPELFRDRLVPVADVVTPNHFELDLLVGRPSRTLVEVVAAARSLAGPRVVLVTSVVVPEVDPGSLAMVAVAADGAWLVRTPLLPIAPNGCGDVTAALFLAHLDAGPAVALSRTASSVFAVLERTLAAGTREIALIAAQEEIAHPPARFEAVRLQ